jgi:hypothetical protein
MGAAMSRSARRVDLLPRGMTDADCAAYLGRSLTWFQQHLTELTEAGFPPKIPIIDLRDREAIDRWLDKQGDPDERLRRDWSAAWQKAAGNGQN